MAAVDLDLVTLLQSVTARTPLTRVVLTNRNQRRFPFQYLRGGKSVELAPDATGELIIKKKGEFSTALARSTFWTKEGSGAAAVYWFTLDLLTDEMNAAFPEGTDVLEDFVFEHTFTENGLVQTPPRALCTIYNRYLQPAEGQPNPTNPDWPLPTNILVKTAQTLSAGEKTQVLTNLGIDSSLLREAVAGPVTFATSGSLGQYWYDAANFRLWVYVGGQFRYFTLISA